MDDFYSHVVRTTDLALSLEDERERQATFQSLSGYLKEQMQMLLSSEREDIRTGQSQEEVASEENDMAVNAISTFQQMVWRLKEPKYTLGIIYLLATEANTAFVNSNFCAKRNVIDSITYLLRQYTPESYPDVIFMREQTLHVPHMFCKLCKGYAEIMREEGRAMEAIVPLQAAVEMSRPASETVVPIEVELLLCYITAKMYGVGARWIDTHLPYRVSPKDTALLPLDLLFYLYFAGVIMIGCKRWQDALHYFRAVYDADTACLYLNGVTMEAYKKYILVGLIADGVAPEYPDVPYGMQNRSSAVLSYMNISKGYASGDTFAVDTAITAASSELEAHGNMGLAKAANANLIRRKIYCLKHVYVTLSLQCIKIQVGLSSTEEVENQILSLVESGEMSAVIDHSSGMVTFDKEDWDSHNQTGMLKRIEKDIRFTMELVQRVNDFAGQNHAQDTTSRGGGVMK
eukprot:266768_1